MDFSELQELIRIFEASGLTEIEIEEKGRRMRLSKQGSFAPQPVHMQFPAAPGATSAVTAAPAPAAAPAQDENLLTIDSPMVGTFYTSAAPGEPPFVVPGDTIDKDQTVCIVEAMKIMNEVGSKHAGIIEKILVENGEPVEFGQPLFAIRPLG
ncbi:MAG: acetyl-CoA carboxylase biotin carboxyl carrier protein [Candidatus Hydrogenedentes bacterium]|nr:acetyl-CoA carboxylase biotin carboxyl carrier protein [Candidatus Hydrogenedentota bacterium]